MQNGTLTITIDIVVFLHFEGLLNTIRLDFKMTDFQIHFFKPTQYKFPLPLQFMVGFIAHSLQLNFWCPIFNQELACAQSMPKIKISIKLRIPCGFLLVVGF